VSARVPSRSKTAMGETLCGVSMAMKVGYLLRARESSIGMIRS
jgi:hypothetical protein